MSGGSKKVTVGYWYRLLQAFGICKGPVDAFLEFRAGGRVAWSGEVEETTRLTVNASNLWGGEKKEGGLSGQMDIQLGGADQLANDYLTANLGADQPTYRGKVMAIWRGGRWGAMNPYPKRSEFKVRRILKGWDNDACWYPAKAAIELLNSDIRLEGDGWEYHIQTFDEPNNDWDDFAFPTTGWQQGGELPFSTNGMSGGTFWTPTRSNIWLRRQVTVQTTGITMDLTADNGCVVWVNGALVGTSNATNAPIPGDQQAPVSFEFSASGTVEVIVKAFAEISASDEAGNIVTLAFSALPLIAMNPAHILYDSLTAKDMQGEPVALINDASFRAAADQLYAEGLGICTTYSDEDIDEFQQRILNVIGASLSQSREDGTYYLDLIREVEDPAGLPIISADDLVDLTIEPSSITDMVNSVSVGWFDPERNEERITQPVQNLGAIQAAGRAISEQSEYPEIAVESLALRLAGRDVRARGTPLSKLTMTTNRRGETWKLRPGQKFRLQSPSDGISDMVCVIGEIDVGTLKDGRIKIKAVQDVYSMPTTVYVTPEAGQAPALGSPPRPAPYQRLIEAPYVEVVANLTPSELDYFPNDAAAIMAMGTEPQSGLNYSLYSAPEGLDLADNGTGEWCPSAEVVEASGYLDTAFTLSGGTNLSEVALGTWALWDDEIVRVDAIDPVALTVEFGRGCADTTPAKHSAGSRIWFCGDWGATDGAEYVDGDVVLAKLATRTTSAEMALGTAQELSVAMDQRYFRPYPPAGLLINDAAYPDEITGDVEAVWVPRDRVTQADKLIDTAMPGVGPETGVTYNVRGYIGETLDDSATGLDALTYTWSPSTSSGTGTLEIDAVRGGLVSRQTLRASFSLGGEAPPADPHWASVVSLLHFDGNVTDEAGITTWSEIGTAEISTSFSKFGSGSSSLPDRTSYVERLADPIQRYDLFTIEFFFMLPTGSKDPSGNSAVLSQTVTGSSVGQTIFIDPDDQIYFTRGFNVGSFVRMRGTTAAARDVWHHGALTFDGSTLRLFLDGNLEVSESNSDGWYPSGKFRLGTYRNPSFTTYGFFGYVDELRITNGVARYTASFTPPTVAFPNS